jgi:hypothetical protein
MTKSIPFPLSHKYPRCELCRYWYKAGSYSCREHWKRCALYHIDRSPGSSCSRFAERHVRTEAAAQTAGEL